MDIDSQLNRHRKKKSKFIICFICFEFLSTIISFILIYRESVIRDVGGITRALVFPLLLLWVSIAFSCVLLAFLVVMLTIKSRVVLRGLLPTAIIHCLFSIALISLTVGYQNSFTNKSNIREITLEEFASINEDKASAVIYIGRDNCPFCIEIFPSIIRLSLLNEKGVIYYNTIIDREIRYKEMTEILDSYQVYEVPYVLIVNKGIVEYRFNYDTKDDLLNYLEQAEKSVSMRGGI
jgi:glutaredoxin